MGLGIKLDLRLVLRVRVNVMARDRVSFRLRGSVTVRVV